MMVDLCNNPFMSENSGDKNKGDPMFPFGGSGGGPKMPDFKGFGGWKFLLVYIIILIIGMSLFNYVFLNKMNPAIDFSEFKARISTGEIKRVEMTDSYFTGFTNPDKKESQERFRVLTVLACRIKCTAPFQFTTPSL